MIPYFPVTSGNSDHNSLIEYYFKYFKPGVLRNPTLPSSRTQNTTQYLSVEEVTFFKRVEIVVSRYMTCAFFKTIKN